MRKVLAIIPVASVLEHDFTQLRAVVFNQFTRQNVKSWQSDVEPAFYQRRKSGGIALRPVRRRRETVDDPRLGGVRNHSCSVRIFRESEKQIEIFVRIYASGDAVDPCDLTVLAVACDVSVYEILIGKRIMSGCL